MSSVISGIAIATTLYAFKQMLSKIVNTMYERKEFTCSQALKAATVALNDGDARTAVFFATLALEDEIKNKCGPEFNVKELRNILKRFEEEKIINKHESLKADRLISVRNELLHKGITKTKEDKIRSSVDSVSSIVMKIDEAKKCPFQPMNITKIYK